MIDISNNADFQCEVLDYDGAVLVDFYADWCGPCRMLKSVLEDIFKEHPNVKIVKVNVDNNRDLAVKFEISSIPTLIVFKNGEIVSRSSGNPGKVGVEALIKKFF